MALAAGDAYMGAGQREGSREWSKVALPAFRGMAGGAVLAELTLVSVVLGVAGGAGLGRPQTPDS
jgi:hypothetical protein